MSIKECICRMLMGEKAAKALKESDMVRGNPGDQQLSVEMDKGLM